MNMPCQVSRALDEEHRANLALMARAERAWVQSASAGRPAIAAQLVRHLEHEVERHFAFEEQHLFPRMADAGDGDLAALLAEEHDSIRAVAEELLPLARALALGAPAAGEPESFARLLLELTERQVSHIQKETMALLPLLDDLLDDQTDRELAFAFAAD